MKKWIAVLFMFLFSVYVQGAKKYKLVEVITNMGIIKVKLYEGTPRHSENFLKWVKEHHYDSVLFHRVIKDFMIQGGASDSKGAVMGQPVGLTDPGYTIDAEFRPEYRHIKGALAAARQGDEVNPEKKSSGEQFYIVQGKTYTDKQLDLLEQQRLARAKSKLGGELFQAVKDKHMAYLRKGQKQQADKLVSEINATIQERFAGENPYRFTPESRELYKSVGGTPFLDGDYTVFGEVVEGLDVLDKIAAVETDSNDRPIDNVVIIGMKLKRK